MHKYKFPRNPAPDWPAKYIGIKWVWRGREIETGIDCHGLLVEIYCRDFGVAIPDYLTHQTAKTEAGRVRQTAQLIKQGITGWREIELPMAGVGVLFRTATSPVHVGVCTGGGDFLHACQTLGQVVRERLSDHQNNILGYFVPACVVRP